MRGVATWIMVAGGIMIGLVVITISMSIAANIFKSNQEASMLSQYADIVNRAESICASSPGNVDFLRVKIPEITRAIYPGRSKFQEPPDKVSDLISRGMSGNGDHVCLQFFENPEPRCSKIDCQLEMAYVGSPSLKDDLFSLVSKLGGTSPVYEYFMTIEREKDKVVIKAQKVISEKPVFCTVESLAGVEIAGSCEASGQKSPVLVIKDNVAVISDSTPWNNNDGGFAQLLTDLSKKLGSNPMIIWEADKTVSSKAGQYAANCVATGQRDASGYDIVECQGSEPQSKPNIITAFKNAGGNDGSGIIRRDSKIGASTLSGHDVVWLIRPGFCNKWATKSDAAKQALGCTGIDILRNDEIGALVDYVKGGGKLIIIAEPVDENANLILEQLGMEFEISAQGSCSGKYVHESSGFGSSATTFKVDSAGVFECR